MQVDCTFVFGDILNWYYWIFVALVAALILGGIFFTLAYRGRKPVYAVEFLPPECKLIHFSAFWHGYTRKSDLSALLVQWAQMGCVSIEKDGKSDVILHKLKDLPEHRVGAERKYFNALFHGRDTFCSKQLKEYDSRERLLISYAVGDLLDEATTPVVYAKGVIPVRAGVVISSLFCAFLLLIYFCIATASYGMLTFTVIFAILYSLIVMGATLAWESFRGGRGGSKTSRFLYLVMTLVTLVAITPFCLFYGLMMNTVYDVALDYAYLIVINGVWIALCVVCANKLITKRNGDSQKLYAKMLGFRQFVKMAELDKLETLLQEIPDYYDEILPYCMVMGLSRKVDKKFSYLKTAAPEWAIGFDLNAMASSVFNAVKASVKIKPRKEKPTTSKN